MKKLNQILNATILIILVSSISSLCGQGSSEPNERWEIELRELLLLDEPFICDSTFSALSNGADHIFNISSKRPDVEKAWNLLDTIVYQYSDNDTTYAKLFLILWEFDARYIEEFSVNNDNWYPTIYHNDYQKINDSSKPKNELHLIGKMEWTLKLLQLLKKDISYFNDVLVGEENDFFEKESSVSQTWRLVGHADLRFLIDYYENNQELYEDELFERTKQNLGRSQAHSLIRILNLFKDRDINFNCSDVEKRINEQTSQAVLLAIKESNDAQHKLACIDKIINKFLE